MANRTGSTDNWPAGTWIGVGVLLAVLTALVGAAAGEAAMLVLTLGGVASTVVLGIGVIGKGVAVGLRDARDAQHTPPA